jgi:Flp pilus assembly protein TadG
MRRRSQTRSHRQAGQSLVETALMMAVIFAVVFWTFELGWQMYLYTVMADAANEGVRYAVVHSGADPNGTKAQVKTFAGISLSDVGAVSVSVSDPDGGYTPPNRVKVTVTYTFVNSFAHLSLSPTIHAYAEGRMVAP